MKTPDTTPLEQWPTAWLKLECAGLLNNAMYPAMHDHEKYEAGYPVSDLEMIAFIKDKWS